MAVYRLCTGVHAYDEKFLSIFVDRTNYTIADEQESNSNRSPLVGTAAADEDSSTLGRALVEGSLCLGASALEREIRDWERAEG